MALGDSRKYPYHTTDGFLEFRGQGGGGSFQLEIRRHGGILTIGIPKAWGGFRSGISTGDRQECIPWKRIDQSDMCSCSFAEENRQNILNEKQFCRTSIFPHSVWPRQSGLLNYYFVHTVWNMVFLTEDTIFEAGSDCWPRWLKFKMAGTKIHSIVISYECTHVHHTIFLF